MCVQVADLLTSRLLESQPARLICCKSTESDDSVIGQLGGRDIVKAGSIDPKEYFVKHITKGKVHLCIHMRPPLWAGRRQPMGMQHPQG